MASEVVDFITIKILLIRIVAYLGAAFDTFAYTFIVGYLPVAASLLVPFCMPPFLLQWHLLYI